MLSSFPVIVGIDPGTTTGLAVLDLSGELLLLFSKRGIRKSELVKMILDIGRPVIVACDRNPAPQKVEKISSLFSARLIVPGVNLAVRDKSLLFSNYRKKHDLRASKHERDALSSAAFAFNCIKPTMKRVDQRLNSLGHSGNNELERFVKTRIIINRDHVKRAIDRYEKDFGADI